MSAWTCTPSATGVNVAVPLTLFPAVGLSTAIAFDDAADFAAGVCASAIKPAHDRNSRPLKETRNNFISASVFRTARQVQPHQIVGSSWPRVSHGRCRTQHRLTATFKRGLS